MQELRNIWGPGTCTEGTSGYQTGTDVADGVAGPAGIGEGIVPRPPGCAEDRAFMCCVIAVLLVYPAVVHIQACLLYRAHQRHVTGTFPRGLKVHSDARFQQPS